MGSAIFAKVIRRDAVRAAMSAAVGAEVREAAKGGSFPHLGDHSAYTAQHPRGGPQRAWRTGGGRLHWHEYTQWTQSASVHAPSTGIYGRFTSVLAIRATAAHTAPAHGPCSPRRVSQGRWVRGVGIVGMARPWLISDEQWAVLQALLLAQPPVRGRPRRDHGQVLEGITYHYRTGVAWRDLRFPLDRRGIDNEDRDAREAEEVRSGAS